MKDIPVFTTEHGVAHLGLQGIPAWGSAYVKIVSSLAPEMLLQECADFCRACGAKTVYASGDACLEAYACTAVLVKMQRPCAGMEKTDAAIFPMTAETAAKWRQIYNVKMASVPNARYMTYADDKIFLQDGDCYFIHRNEELLGIGKASGSSIQVVTSLQPGAGKNVVLALTSALSGDTVSLIVAQENRKAVALYSRLGFIPVGETGRWYKIF